MKTIIVAISVDYVNPRKVCNLIENKVFETYNDLRNVLNSELEVEENDVNQPQFFTMTEFMEECNDQYFDFEGTFISYVNLKES